MFVEVSCPHVVISQLQLLRKLQRAKVRDVHYQIHNQTVAPQANQSVRDPAR